LNTLQTSVPTFDLIAIGSGPAGRQAAMQAAQLGKRVAIVERDHSLAGASKTLRAAILELMGEAARVYTGAFRVKHEITVDDLVWRAQQVTEHERDALAGRLRRHGVHVIEGDASFADAHTVAVRLAGTERLLRADRIVVAVGTRPDRPDGIDFDGRTVLDMDGILDLGRLPTTLTVVGGGVIGLEYASMAAALGVHVTVVERHPRILDCVDDELVEALKYHLRGLGLVFRLGEEAVRIERGGGAGAVTHLRDGSRIESDVVFYAAGRRAATDALDLSAAGLEADVRGRIAVGADLRTSQPHIFAAGDVVDFPTLAAASMEQGRLAALAAFDRPHDPFRRLLPYGIYTIPELSFVGSGERSLTSAAVPFVAGVARYRDLSRGEIAGDRSGLLKLLVHAESRRVLGVHIFGTSATELVHVGQTIMAANLPVDYVADAVFDVATFTDAYKVAALDALERLDELPDAAAA
jgi:NAD(P) transhydrogenase